MAEVVLIPIPEQKDIEVQALNIWRRDLGLDPLNESDSEKQQQKVEVGANGTGNLYEMTGSSPKQDKIKSRVIGVATSHDNFLWLIKMFGEDSLVAEQKPAFLKFLKSLHFVAPAPQLASSEKPISTNSKEIPPSADLPKWKVPAGCRRKLQGRCCWPAIISVIRGRKQT